MKNWYSFLTILITLSTLLSGCKKEECLYCTAYLTNTSQVTATVSVDGLGAYKIEPQQTRPVDLSNHSKNHRIQVYFENPSHFDYDFIQGCDEKCADPKILLTH